MKIMQSFGVAVAMICSLLLIGVVNSSHAIEIEEFPSDTDDTSYGGYTYHMAYVKTDNPIYHVSWYIDNEWVYGETLNSTTSYASYYPYDKIPGIISGEEYKIGVKVWEWDAEDEEFRSTTDSYNVRMFEPMVEYDAHPKELNGVRGYAELSKHYRNGNDVIMDFYVEVSYSGDEEVRYSVSTEFKNTVDGNTEPGPDPTGEIGYDEDDSDLKSSFSDSGSITNDTLNFRDRNMSYRCEAYVTITVNATPKRDWHIPNVLWFSPE